MVSPAFKCEKVKTGYGTTGTLVAARFVFQNRVDCSTPRNAASACPPKRIWRYPQTVPKFQILSSDNFFVLGENFLAALKSPKTTTKIIIINNIIRWNNRNNDCKSTTCVVPCREQNRTFWNRLEQSLPINHLRYSIAECCRLVAPPLPANSLGPYRPEYALRTLLQVQHCSVECSCGITLA